MFYRELFITAYDSSASVLCSGLCNKIMHVVTAERACQLTLQRIYK